MDVTNCMYKRHLFYKLTRILTTHWSYILDKIVLTYIGYLYNHSSYSSFFLTYYPCIIPQNVSTRNLYPKSKHIIASQLPNSYPTNKSAHFKFLPYHHCVKRAWFSCPNQCETSLIPFQLYALLERPLLLFNKFLTNNCKFAS